MSRDMSAAAVSRYQSIALASTNTTLEHLQSDPPPDDLGEAASHYPPMGATRPLTRAECAGKTRPCPWVSCRYHLYLDVNPETGQIKINFPDLESWELPETCALDMAAQGGVTLREIGAVMNLTHEPVRDIVAGALRKIRDSLTAREPADNRPGGLR